MRCSLRPRIRCTGTEACHAFFTCWVQPTVPQVPQGRKGAVGTLFFRVFRLECLYGALHVVLHPIAPMNSFSHKCRHSTDEAHRLMFAPLA